MAPVQPSGWPRAMAPPLTLMISGSSPNCSDHRQGLGGESLVQLDQADVALLQAGHLQSRRDRLDRAYAHDLRRHPLDGEGDKAGQRFLACLLENTSSETTSAAAAPSVICELVAGRDCAVQLENRLELGQPRKAWCRHAHRHRCTTVFLLLTALFLTMATSSTSTGMISSAKRPAAMAAAAF